MHKLERTEREREREGEACLSIELGDWLSVYVHPITKLVSS